MRTVADRDDSRDPTSDLTDAIDRFLAEYPDDVELTWKQPRRKPSTQSGRALDTAMSDLVAAHERSRRRG